MFNDCELNEDEMHLYSRQILLDDWDLEAQEKLKLANVFIVGCGGIGCQTAELLARAGVGKISLCDPDQIEISNVQRQVAFSPEHVGAYKADVLANRLRAINPHIEIQAYTQALDEHYAVEYLQGQDLILDGCDNFQTRYLVNRTCVELSLPYISASAIAYRGQLFMVTADSACYACLFPEQDATDQALRCADTGVLATTPNVMASLQAHHALLYLGLGETPLAQKLLLWNGRTMQQKIRSFAADEDCRICQSRSHC